MNGLSVNRRGLLGGWRRSRLRLLGWLSLFSSRQLSRCLGLRNRIKQATCGCGNRVRGIEKTKWTTCVARMRPRADLGRRGQDGGTPGITQGRDSCLVHGLGTVRTEIAELQLTSK